MYGLQFGVYYKLRNQLINKDTGRIETGNSFILGALSGVFSTLFTHPLKNLEIKKILIKNESLFKLDGPSSYFRGGLCSLLESIPLAGSMFLSYEYLTNVFNKDKNTVKTFVSGSISAGIGKIISYPLSIINFELNQQLIELKDIVNLKYNGMYDCLVQILTKKGIGGLYQNLFPCLIKTAPFFGFLFVFFEMLKSQLK